jgi:glutamate dehydrogenase (NAD(P)+)
MAENPYENPYNVALKQFDKAVQYLDLKPGLVESLRYPKRELTVNFPVEMDNGSVRTFTAGTHQGGNSLSS